MYQRYAIYAGAQGDLAKAGATWLGWDLSTGSAVPHPDLQGLDLDALTAVPRKYGFHGTIKPPFHLAPGTTFEDLRSKALDVIGQRPRITLDGLEVSRIGRFLALTPVGTQSALAALAGHIVMSLDDFRAPPSAAEQARRRKARLTPAQEENLQNWGYPYVLNEFRYHMTLTGPLDDPAPVLQAAEGYFAPALMTPYELTSLNLVGQREDGMFELIEEIPLASS